MIWLNLSEECWSGWPRQKTAQWSVNLVRSVFNDLVGLVRRVLDNLFDLIRRMFDKISEQNIKE